MSRGLSNCNPGNIRQSKVRYKGEVQPSRDPAFKQFESLAWGYRAVFAPWPPTRASTPTSRSTRSTRRR